VCVFEKNGLNERQRERVGVDGRVRERDRNEIIFL
jgi:hypothetical protein